MSDWEKHLDLQPDDLPHDLVSDDKADVTVGPIFEEIESLAHDLHLPVGGLREILDLFADKRQIVFSGPPGTGKTFVAQKLARFVTGDEGRVEFLQFHPSYSYEDFVEGFRPQSDEATGLLSFHVRPGPLREMARRAQAAYDSCGGENPPIFVMVIDEINRANLSRVFGELFFALEYREQAVRLQYSPNDPPLRLPPNLWFIGTMNTVDRSIASFDAALRRRFYFVDFDPTRAPFDGVLRSFVNRVYADRSVDLRWLPRLVEHVNKNLPDKRFALGPSYFMRQDLSEELARRAWTFTIRPFLDDRFGAELIDEDFDWSKLVARAKSEGEGDVASHLTTAVGAADNLGQTGATASD